MCHRLDPRCLSKLVVKAGKEIALDGAHSPEQSEELVRHILRQVRIAIWSQTRALTEGLQDTRCEGSESGNFGLGD